MAQNKNSNPAGAPRLEDSYAHCVRVAKERAGNFHFAFQVLPPEPYRGICALYAFARLADDYSDDEPDPERALANARRLREAVARALDGRPGDERILPAVVDTVRRFRIDPRYLYELMDGTEMDAARKRYATWEETRRYCYLVASVIGIMTIHVFGFSDPEGKARTWAEETGIAFQLTNILRDIKEDAGRDRIYLPGEDLRRFGVREDDLLAGRDSTAFRALVKHEVERALGYYASGRKLVALIDPPCRPALEALVGIYRRLLEKIPQRDYDILSRRVALSKLEKVRLAGAFAAKSLLKNPARGTSV